ncbi:MAG: hypothetical protein IKZ60_05405, partial [Bacteroidales bacterium]|nr:hypothetical protein [Bacteroidales bacterium]
MRAGLTILLATLICSAAASQEVRGPFSMADKIMNSTVIARTGGVYELRQKTDKIFTPIFSADSLYSSWKDAPLALDRNRLDFFSYALNSKLYKEAAALLFADGLFPESDTLRYLKGLLAYDIHDFALAAKNFSELTAESPFQPTAQAFLNTWTSQPELPDYKDKSPWLAGAMSAVIPGSGKIYAGDLRSGVSTFLIVGALGAMAAESWAKLGIKDWRTITLSSLFGIFYTANIYGSALSVSLTKQAYEDAQKATLLFDLRIPL